MILKHCARCARKARIDLMMIKNFNDVGDIIDDMYAEYEKEEKDNEKKMAKEKCKMAWQIALNYICCISEDEESAKVIEAKVEEN